jgi:ankyrin repeat protein
MNVEQLRKQAKELVKAARAGDADALRRLGGREPILARAQLVVARENGYASWPALVIAAEADADSFVRAATARRRDRADAMLAAQPALERDRWARLVLGRGWDGDPNEPGGPRNWPPLLYACHSVYAPRALVSDLLERGADPNSSHREEWGRNTALLGAAGVLHDPELTGLLLRAGADPDDEESLYHSTETESPGCLRLLLAHGAETRGTNALARSLDFDRIEPVRLLLEHGADPNEFASVAHAVRRRRRPEFIRLLAEFDADLERRGSEGWRGDPEVRTPYQHAVLRNRDDAARALAELGAATEPYPGDDAVAAVGRGERRSSPLPEPLDPDQQEVVVEAALSGHLDLVLELLGPRFEGVAPDGGPRGTLLHWAGWVGAAEIARTLLAEGADPLGESDNEFATPAAWCALGSQHWRLPDHDYVGVMEQLVAAGAELEPRFEEVAHGPLYEWLVSHRSA